MVLDQELSVINSQYNHMSIHLLWEIFKPYNKDLYHQHHQKPLKSHNNLC